MGNDLRITTQPKDGLYTHLRDANDESPVEQVPDEQLNGNGQDSAISSNPPVPVPEPQSNPETDASQGKLKKILHPWGMIDYHLYLSMVDKKTLHERRNNMYVLNDGKCHPIREDDIDAVLDTELADVEEKRPTFIFNTIPILLSSSSKNGRTFGTGQYVLGFDVASRNLFARRFDQLPPIEHLGENWDRGTDAHCISFIGLMELLDDSFSGEHEIGKGILSSSPESTSVKGEDPGIEIVLATLFSQWISDMGDFLFCSGDGPCRCDTDNNCCYGGCCGRGDDCDGDDDDCNSDDCDDGDSGIDSGIDIDYDDTKCEACVLSDLRSNMETCYLILQRASYRAWFAARDGVSREEYNRKRTIERMTGEFFVSYRAWLAARDGVSREYNRKLTIERITGELFV